MVLVGQMDATSVVVAHDGPGIAAVEVLGAASRCGQRMATGELCDLEKKLKNCQ